MITNSTKKVRYSMFLTILFFGSISLSPPSHALSIFGNDDRHNLNEITDSKILELASSVAVMFQEKTLSSGGKGVIMTGLPLTERVTKSWCAASNCTTITPVC